ncbi:hypothetical protein [Gracilibacillus sp. YIM 98692]|uniref:hypothetical protein n=1 Tax=Gracilibacillus sp. YIM 98692 TaxID=2663532 RepID=UPI0013D64A44|nr:hypothetical protein [Gracilibacillus sp. YIM 98692]
MKRPFMTFIQSDKGFVSPITIFIVHILFLLTFFQVSMYQTTLENTQKDLQQYKIHTLFQMGLQTFIHETDKKDPYHYQFPSGTVEISYSTTYAANDYYIMKVKIMEGATQQRSFELPSNED